MTCPRYTNPMLMLSSTANTTKKSIIKSYKCSLRSLSVQLHVSRPLRVRRCKERRSSSRSWSSNKSESSSISTSPSPSVFAFVLVLLGPGTGAVFAAVVGAGAGPEDLEVLGRVRVPAGLRRSRNLGRRAEKRSDGGGALGSICPRQTGQVLADPSHC